MEQRDLLKDQIEQLGKVLAKVLADIIGFKGQGQAVEGIQKTNEALQEEADINIESLLNLKRRILKCIANLSYLQVRITKSFPTILLR
jgi:hypothetical protein